MESSPQNDNDKLDSFLMTLEGAALSKTAPVYSEFEAYIRLVRGSYGDDDDIEFTQFWLEHAKEFPILSRIAMRIMGGCACSSDVERLFSRAVIIFSPLRSNLKPATLQYLTTLHYWYKLEDSIEESNLARERESVRRCDKFAKLAIQGRKLCINNGEDYCDSEPSDKDE